MSELSENDKDDPTYIPKSVVRTRGKGRPKRDEDPDLEKIPEHLIEGYRILQDIMGVSKYFQQDPNPMDKGMYDYYEVIKQPMCFDEIRRKFVEKEYTQLGEFTYDVRQLLLNCYRFFGPNVIQTKRALRVEELFEQKIALLSEEQRELCSLQATHGKLENVQENAAAVTDQETPQFESKLLKSVANERENRIRERKKKLSEELQSEKEGEKKEMVLWETETLFQQDEYQMMKHMWEIPVIGHFVSLALYELNIQMLSMYEIERMFLIPQASNGLARLMTTLLSTPHTRMKIHTKPSMPYSVWSKKLGLKVSSWYKIYTKSNSDPQFVFEKFGIEHQFWKIFGNSNPLEDHEFCELTFHQRVFLVKTLCDYILQNHKSIRDTIAEMTEEFVITLGEDRTGAKYIYFPQFLNLDVRVYKQNLDPKTWIDRDMDHQAEILKVKIGNSKLNSKLNRKKHKRKTSWKLGKITKRVPHRGIISKMEEKKLKCVISFKTKVQVVEDTEPKTVHPNLSNGEPQNSVQQHVNTEDKDLETGEIKVKIEENENTDDQTNKFNCSCEETNRADNLTKIESNIDEEKVKPLVFIKNKNEYKVENIDFKTEIKVENDNEKVNKEKKSLYRATWLEPNSEDFTLVADSVEGVRNLLEQFCDDDLELIQRLRKRKNKRPNCEVKLARRLVTFINDLETLELKLVMERKKTRAKLYQEWQDFINRPPDFIDPDEAFWLNEKEPVETHDSEVPESPMVMKPDLTSPMRIDLPQIPDGNPLTTADADSQDAGAGGMTLRHRRIENPPSSEIAHFYSSDTEEQSSEDESDTWVLPKKRKKKRTKHLKYSLSNLSSKKKQNDAEEVTGKTTPPADSEIEILDYIQKSPNKKGTSILQVKKRLFLHSEDNHHLEWEKNTQKLVNVASTESTKELKTIPKTKIIMDSSNKILLDNSGIISVPSTNNNQALTSLQGRKLDDIIRQGKLVKGGKRVITGVIGVEKVENSKTLKQNNNHSDQRLLVGEQNLAQTNASDISDKCDKSSNYVHAMVPCVNQDKTTFVKVLEEKFSDIAGNVNPGAVQALSYVPQSPDLKASKNNPSSHSQNTQPVNVNVNSQVQSPLNTNVNLVLTSSVSKSQPLTTPSRSSSKAPQDVSRCEEVVVLSDESDNDVEFVDVVYNPKLDRNLAAHKNPRTKCILRDNINSFTSVQGQQNASRRSYNVNPEVSVRQMSVTQKEVHMPSQLSPQNATVPSSVISILPVHTPGKVNLVNEIKKYNNLTPNGPTSIQYSNQNVPTTKISNSVVPVTQIASLNPQRNSTFTTQVQKSCISSPSSSQINCTLVHQTNRVSASSLGGSPGSSIHHPQSPGSNIYRRIPPQNPSTFTPPGTPKNNIIRGNITISPTSNVPQPRTPINRQVGARGTLVQMSVRSPSAQYRLNSPRATLQRPISSPSTQILQGASNTVSRFQISPRQQSPISRVNKSIYQGHSSVHSLSISPSQPRGMLQNPSPSQRPADMSALQGLATPRKHSNENPALNSGNRKTARLVVVPGDENTGSNYGLIFPDGNRVILSTKQVADIRSANGGNLPMNIEW